METLTRVFQLSIYGLLVLSALILMDAEGAIMPQGLTIPMAVAAWLFVERRPILRLPQWLASLLGIIGLGLAGGEFLLGSIESRLLAGAHLLVYLSWVVLFQTKSARQYWWMAALSLLQVAVGSVLTTSGSYGLLLVVFFVAAIWTLSLFSLWTASERIRLAQPRFENPSPDDRLDDDLEEIAPAPLSSTQTLEDPYAVLKAVSIARSAVQHDLHERWMTLRFLCGTLATSIAAVVLATIFFMAIPRLWIGMPAFGAEASLPALGTVTGFAEEVRLGDIGRILESNEPVFSVELFDNSTNESITVEEYTSRLGMDEPLIRGATLTTYERGHWSSSGFVGRMEQMPNRPAPGAARVRQQITLHPLGSEILLAIFPAAECRLPNFRPAQRHPLLGTIIMPGRTRSRLPISYTVWSPHPGAEGSGLRPISEYPERFRNIVWASLTQIPGQGLNDLTAQARKVAGFNQPKKPSAREIERRLIYWLRDSGEFSYTLEASISNGRVDPVEDFLFNRKKGHCEYFASALALCLRACDVPSRMVSGFKGGKINAINGTFEVEQRHAHAWVEAYIDDAWETLDATPAAERTESLESFQPTMPTFRDLLAFMKDLWSSHVVNLTISQQRENFYEPLRIFAEEFKKAMSGEESPAKLLRRIGDFVKSPSEWFSVAGGIVSFVLMSLAAATLWTIRRIRKNWPSWKKRVEEARRGQSPTIAFYDRFRKLCEQHGLTRSEFQTQREFADEVVAAWSARLQSHQISTFPEEVSELFYEVRFGDHSLPQEKLDRLEQGLNSLQIALKGPATKES